MKLIFARNTVVKTLLPIVLLLTMVGCKLNVIVPPGGNVESSNFQSSDCAGGNVCEIEITDPDYVDGFTALPDPGYEFVRWQNGTAFSCGDSTNTTCEVALPGGALGAAATSLFLTMYIMPVWEDIGIDTDLDGTRNELDEDDDNDGLLDVDDNCPLLAPDQDGFGCPGLPITSIFYNVDSTEEWAQLDIFLGVTYEEVAAVCPAGVCAGLLNGHVVTGWTWADGAKTAALLNDWAGDTFYSSPGKSVLGPVPPGTLDDALSIAGISPHPQSDNGFTFVVGWISNPPPNNHAWLSELSQFIFWGINTPLDDPSSIDANLERYIDDASKSVWLYRALP